MLAYPKPLGIRIVLSSRQLRHITLNCVALLDLGAALIIKPDIRISFEIYVDYIQKKSSIHIAVIMRYHHNLRPDDASELGLQKNLKSTVYVVPPLCLRIC